MKKNRIIKVLSFLLLVGMFFIPDIKVKAADGGTVYASVEKFTLGQGYLIKPVAVQFKDGETYADIIKKLLKENGYNYNASVGSMGFYLASIDNADNGVLNVPKCIQDMPDDDMPKNKIEMDNPYKSTNGLGEYSYSRYSGWYYFVNNVAQNVGMSGVKAKDGDVVRYQFTLYGIGADLGDTTAEQYGGAKALKLPNRDSVTKKLAIMSQNPGYNQNGTWVKIYNQAIEVTADMDSTQEQVTTVENQLPTASQITGWIQQQSQKKAEEEEKKAEEEARKKAAEEAKKKAAEEAKKTQQKAAEEAKKALIKKNTPAKTTLKAVKKSGKNKVQLIWKKAGRATGYEVYQSMRKNSGYKRVKVVKGTTCKTKALKKKKIYYFKIRTYRKVGGKTYYGAFSNIKKIKIK